MARSITLTWAGGEHDFDLSKIEMLRALQTACDAGPAWILGRLGSGQWNVEDVVSTIRLGLEGGGMAKDEARKLVRRYVEEDFGVKHVLVAKAILLSALYGEEDETDDQGEANPAAE